MVKMLRKNPIFHDIPLRVQRVPTAAIYRI
jgi:hypothetical protein